jgi:hypothetical protein
MILETLLTGRTIAFNVKLVWITGSVNAALLLSQLCYWSDKGDIRNLFYKTINEVEDEIGLSRHEQDAAIKILLSKNFIGLDKRGVPPKRYFSIYWEAIEKALRSAENTRPVQIAEKRQINLRKQNAKNEQKSCRKSSNQNAEKRQIELPKNGKFHIDDYIDDKIEEKEREEQKFSEDEINAFVVRLCSRENIRSPLAYAFKIREKIASSHKATLLALSDFVSKMQTQKGLSEFDVLNSEYYARVFTHDGVVYVFHKVGLCVLDKRFEGRGLDISSVFLDSWFNGFSHDPKLFVFDDLESLKKYLERIFDEKK